MSTTHPQYVSISETDTERDNKQRGKQHLVILYEEYMERLCTIFHF